MSTIEKRRQALENKLEIPHAAIQQQAVFSIAQLASEALLASKSRTQQHQHQHVASITSITKSSNEFLQSLVNVCLSHRSASVVEAAIEALQSLVRHEQALLPRALLVQELLGVWSTMPATVVPLATSVLVQLEREIYRQQQRANASEDLKQQHRSMAIMSNVGARSNALVQALSSRASTSITLLTIMSRALERLSHDSTQHQQQDQHDHRQHHDHEDEDGEDAIITWSEFLGVFGAAIRWLLMRSSVELSGFRVALHSNLVRMLAASSDDNDHDSDNDHWIGWEVAAMLAAFLPYYSVRSTNDLAYVIQVYNHLLDALQHGGHAHERLVLEFTLARRLLSTMCERRALGDEIASMLSVLRRMRVEFQADLAHDPLVPVGLAYLLLGGTRDEQLAVLQLLADLLDAHMSGTTGGLHWRAMVLPFLVFPLLQLVSCPITSIREQCESLLHAIDQATSTASSKQSSATASDATAARLDAAALAACEQEHPDAIDSDLSALFSVQLLLAKTMSTTTTTTTTNNSECCQLLAWLHQAAETLACESTASSLNSAMLNFCVAPFVFHSTPRVRSAAVAVIKATVPLNALECGMAFLPLLMYRLGRETDATVLLDVLYALPALGADESCYPAVSRTLMPLLDHTVLAPTAVQLWCRLWQVQFRAFGRLTSVLQRTYEQSTSKDEHTRDQLQIAVAVALRDICARNPSRGLDLISLLSTILGSDGSAPVVCFAIQALHALCAGTDKDEGVIEFRTAWHVISAKLGKDTRPMVLEQLCRLLEQGTSEVELATEVEGEQPPPPNTEQSPDDDDEQDDQAEEPDGDAEPEASKATDGQADETEDQAEGDDEDGEDEEEEEEVDFVQDMLQRIIACCGHADAPVREAAFKALHQYGKTHLPLITDYTHRAYNACIYDRADGVRAAARPIVTMVLQDELRFLHRLGSNATHPFPALRSLAQVSEYVREAYDEASQPSLTPALAGAILWCFQPNDGTKAGTDRGTKLARSHSYRQALSDILTDLRTPDWLQRALAISGWSKFMHSCVAAMLDAETAKAEATGAADTNAATIAGAVAERTREMFLAKKHASPAVAENALLAHAVSSLAFPPSAAHVVERIADDLDGILSEDLNEWTSYAAAVGLGCVSQAIHSTGITRLLTIHDTLRARLQPGPSNTPWVAFGSAMGLGLLASALRQQATHDSLDPESQLLESVLATLVRYIEAHLAAIPTATTAAPTADTDMPWGLTGACIALGFAANTLGTTDSLLPLLALLRRLLDSTEMHGNHATIVCAVAGACVALPAITVRCFRLNLVDNATVIAVLQAVWTLVNDAEASAQVRAAAMLGYTALVQSLTLVGFTMPPTHSQLLSSPENLASWLCTLASADTEGDDQQHIRIGAVLALANLCGGNLVCPVLFQDSHDSSSLLLQAAQHLSPALLNSAPASTTLHSSDDALAWLTQVLAALKALQRPTSGDRKVALASVWALGSLSRPLPPASLGTTADLSHLRPDSMLRMILSIVQNASSSALSAPEESDAAAKVDVAAACTSALACLGQVKTANLPNLNWPLLLQRLMRADLGNELQCQVLAFALAHITNASLASWLSTNADRSQFVLQSAAVQERLLAALPKLVTVFATARSRQLVIDFTHEVMLEHGCANNTRHKLVLLKAYRAALGEPGLYASVVSEIHTSILLAYAALPSPLLAIANDTTGPSSRTHALHHERALLLWHLVQCLELLPTELITANISVAADAASEAEAPQKAVFVVALLAYRGTLSLRALVRCRTWLFSHSDLGVSSVLLSAMTLPLGTYQMTDEDKAQWLFDSLDAITMCKMPIASLRVIAATLMAWNNRDLLVLLRDPTAVVPLDATQQYCQDPHDERLLRELHPLESPESVLPLLLQQLAVRTLAGKRSTQLATGLLQRVVSLASNEHLPERVRQLLEQAHLSIRRATAEMLKIQ